jgi:fibronectin type 3 domain-containing protein
LRSTTSTGGYGRIATTSGNSATNYTDSSVVNYVTYYYEVEEVAASTSANSAPPASAYAVGLEPAPVGLAVSSLNGAAGLVWYPSFGATGYQVLRATSNPGSQASYSVVASPSVALYTNTSLANGTTYYYEVAAVNGFGTGTNSAYVSGTPAVPNAGIAAHDGGVGSTQYVAGSSSINLNVEVTPGANALVAALYDNNGGDTMNASPQFMVWSNYSTGTTQILTRAVSENSAGYNYTDGDLYYLWNPGPGAGVVSATDTNSALPTAMLMQVYSLSGVDTTNFNGGIPYSAGADSSSASILQVTTPANTPNGSWAPVISFNYNGGGGNFLTNTGSSGTPNDFNFQKDGNQNNLGYIANLIAGSSTITATASGGPTLMALATEVLAPGAGGTPAPTNVVATGQQNQVAVSWDDASGGAATSYTLYRSTSNGTGFSSIVTNNGNGSTNYTDHAVSDWTTYYYVVKAASPNGISLFSTPVVSATPTGLPGTATALTATNAINSVLLSWNDLGATNFNVLRAANTPTGFAVVANVNGNAYTNPGTEATLYYYEIQPINFFGTGSVSSAVSAIPCVAFFTNWITIANDSTCTNGWIWNTPGVSDSLFYTRRPILCPGLRKATWILQCSWGPIMARNPAAL